MTTHEIREKQKHDMGIDNEEHNDRPQTYNEAMAEEYGPPRIFLNEDGDEYLDY